MTVQRYLQVQGQSHHMNGSSSQQQQGSQHRKLDRSLSEPKSPKGQSQNTNSSRYKTELCRPFEESGVCKYGDKCQFAHGFQELRTLTRHPKYKTELCCTFHTTGLCPYGSRCHFIHNPDENRAKIMPTLAMAQSSIHQNKNSTLHGMCHSSNQQQQQQQQQQTLRSLSIGSSVSSSSSGELSPSSSPGMFDDPFSPGFYGAATGAPTSRAGAVLSNAISAFGADFEMSTLAAAFSAAEGNHGGLLKGSVSSAPGTSPFGSQLNLLSSSSSSSSCSGPWGSPSSSSQDLFQFPSGSVDIHCSLNMNQQQLFDAQSSPVDNISFDFDSLTLGAARNVNRANASPHLTRLPIFNQLAHSD